MQQNLVPSETHDAHRNAWAQPLQQRRQTEDPPAARGDVHPAELLEDPERWDGMS